MLRRVQCLMVMVMLLSVGLLPAYAQEALVPDKPVDGEITDEEYAQEYRFQGEAGQIVVLEITPKELPGDLDSPALILRDSVGNELARYNGYGRTLLFWELPKNGTYTVIATRTDDENGLSVGEYTLLLRFPQTIELNETIENTIINDHVDYYMVRSTEDFALSITRDGDFSPEFSINEINTEFVPGTLNSVASIGGKYATQGLVGVIPGGVAYLVRVGRGTLDFQFGDVTADYTLVLKRAE